VSGGLTRTASRSRSTAPAARGSCRAPDIQGLEQRRPDHRRRHAIGPLTDASAVRDVQRYLAYVRDEARQRFDAGMDEIAAADDIDLADFSDWGDKERIAVNITTLYREFDPSLPEVPVPEQFVRMARWAARH
jgi:hypothetical protein